MKRKNRKHKVQIINRSPSRVFIDVAGFSSVRRPIEPDTELELLVSEQSQFFKYDKVIFKKDYTISYTKNRNYRNPKADPKNGILTTKIKNERFYKNKFMIEIMGLGEKQVRLFPGDYAVIQWDVLKDIGSPEMMYKEITLYPDAEIETQDPRYAQGIRIQKIQDIEYKKRPAEELDMIYFQQQKRRRKELGLDDTEASK